MQALSEEFQPFPDTWEELYQQGLAYFRFAVPKDKALSCEQDVTEAINKGELDLIPIVYEDFLPVSAAGIFQSNLGDKAEHSQHVSSNQSEFESALGCSIVDPFALYEAQQQAATQALLSK